MQTPKFLQELISSPEYGDKNSETYKRATKYMNILYPGTVAFDVTGRMMRPEYDMTLEQFYDAQHEIETEFESDKSEAEADVLDTYGDYFEISKDADGLHCAPAFEGVCFINGGTD